MLKNKLIKLKQAIKLLNINFQPSIKNYIIVERDNDVKKLDAPKENTHGKYNNWDFFKKYRKRI